jgi:ribonuclease D
MEAKATSTLPPAGFSHIRDQEALEKLVERIRAGNRVAVDTEADSLHNYSEKVCLIQLSLVGEHYIVDPLAGLDFDGFLAALAQMPLILHGGDYDLRMLRASMAFRPEREVFDTMIAAQLLGIEQIGLAALVERFLGMTVGKEGQKSDWSRRPLSEKQLSYAVNDTRFLEQLADRLAAELSDRGRLNWHLESCRAMVESTRRESSRDPEEAWRIKGSGRLSRRQLAYLRQLWRWRDEHARRLNVPPFKILGNEQLFQILSWADSHRGAPLREGLKLPRNIVGARLHTLEETLARAAKLPASEWPEPKKREGERPLSGQCLRHFEVLRAACARIAKELSIVASTLAPRAALEAIVRSPPRTVDEIMRASGLLRWQAELMRDVIEKTLRPKG